MHIGDFEPSKDGGWTGFIHTLTISTKVRLVPNDDRTTDDAPAFRALIGNMRAGFAWEARTTRNPPKNFLRLRIDDPVLVKPLTAALFPSDSGNSAELVWNRRKA